MIPEIFRIPEFLGVGPIPVNSFGLAIALALIAGTILLSRSFGLRGIEPRLAERYVIWGGLSGLLGARLWFMFEHLTEASQNPLGMLFANAGFTFYGGFLIAALVLVLLARHDKIPLALFADCLGPTLALGYAIGRLGCQLSGDGDYGVPTDSFWAMSYSTGTVPTPPHVRVFVTPLFESFASLMIAIVLSKLEVIEHFRARAGSLFAVYLILISLERFGIEFFRPNPVFWGGLSEAQCISIGLVLLGAVVFAVGERPRVGSGS